jgi:molecular chaperone GrpE
MTNEEADRPVRPDSEEEAGAAIVSSDTDADRLTDEETAEAAATEANTTAAQIEALRRERDQLRDALLRRRAEFENFRRRTDRERQSWSAEAEAELAKDLVPTLDNLEQALKADGDEKGLRDGLELIQRELLATLTRLGLVVHDPVGRPFDPLTDQALLHEETRDAAEGDVVETLRKGYVFKDRLLRPALVKVAKAVSSEVASETGAPTFRQDPDKVH